MTYQTPTIADFQRNLEALFQKKRDKARDNSERVKAQYIAKGLGGSGPLIEAIARSFDELHSEATDEVINLIDTFVKRTQLDPKGFGVIARQYLETFSTVFIGQISNLGNGNAFQQASWHFEPPADD